MDSTKKKPWHQPCRLLADNRELLLAVFLSFMICAGIRLMDLRLWNSPHLKINGEVILSDSDSYGWMSGAKRLNDNQDKALAKGLRSLSRVTGWSFTTLGYWLPVVLAPLLVIPVCLLTWWWGIPESGVPAGVIAGTCFGFLSRTRLGIFDTDLLVLFFTALLAGTMIIWIESLIRPSVSSARSPLKPACIFLGAFCIGIIYRLYRWFYISSEPIAFSIVFMALLTGLAGAEKNRKIHIFCGILLILTTGTGGLLPFLSALILSISAFAWPQMMENRRSMILITGLLLSVYATTAELDAKVNYINWQINRYTNAAQSDENHSLVKPRDSFSYPDILKSVREAKKSSVSEMVYLVSNSWPVFLMGLSGFVYLAWRRPGVLALLPALLLGIFSVKLGVRFAMYGGIGIGIGLGGAAGFILKEKGVAAFHRWGIQLILCGLFLIPLTMTFKDYQIPRFVPKKMAEALLESRKKTPVDSRFWTWWDFGYVTQYFAERKTIADGLLNDNTLVYPVARIYASDSPELACKLMAYAAEKQNDRLKNPFSGIFTQDQKTQHDFFHRKENDRLPSMEGPSDQYLVVTWENLNLVDWIMRFGSWDLKTGQGRTFKTILLQGHMKVDLKKGTVNINDEVHRFSKAVVITEGSSGVYIYDQPGGKHAVINRILGHVYLMEESLFNSNMVQMLVSDPKKFSPYFQIVLDRFPWFRLYKLSRNLPVR